MAPVDQRLRSNSIRQAGGGVDDFHHAVKAPGQCVLQYVQRIFESHAGPEKEWTKSQAQRFVHVVQNNDDKTPSAIRLLDLPSVDFNQFLQYMTSQDSNVGIPWKKSDLSWPLASYYISSSHNTYLSGNQLSSDSTTAAYTNVLLRGCRCVEVDVWDGNDSDPESSASSAGGDETKEMPKPKRQGTFNRLRKKLPGSLVAKFDKTSLGKKTEEKDGRKPEGKEVPKDGATAARSGTEEAAEESEEPQVSSLEPRVLHGYTLTKEVPFRDVCNAIRESAFTVSDLPLIISLEVHCNPQQQAVMVDIMKESWRGLLVTDTEPQTETPPTSLPSPDDLRGKILVKVKYAPPGAAAQETESGEDDRMSAEPGKTPKKPSKIIQELSRLGVYARAVTFKTWTQPEAAWPTHIFSLSENKFLDHHAKHGMELFNHNKSYLMRAYPSGLRISSSNLNPPVFWGGGTQIVALNWQQTDEGMMLNEGMFAGTGGYVLKPEGYRPDIKSKPAQTGSTQRKSLTLAITFLAGQSIPLPADSSSAKRFNPYVKTEIHVDASHLSPLNDGHVHESEYKVRTRVHRGCDVDFAAERVSFDEIKGLVEELTFVRFTVRDDEFGRDDLAAWACIRLDRLGQGYRFIHLMDSKGTLTEGVVLVKVEKSLR